MITRNAEYKNTGIILAVHKIVNVQIPDPDSGVVRFQVAGWTSEQAIEGNKAGLTEASLQTTIDKTQAVLPQIEAYVLALPVFPPAQPNPNMPPRP
jgi:hypothetical protein